MPRALDLITVATPADPALDLALTHAILQDVARAARPATLRVFRPGAAVAFGRLDRLSPAPFAAAAAAARAHGFVPLLRSVGGHAAVFDERCVVVELVTPQARIADGLEERFTEQAQLLRDVLAARGADARIGELAGEYCPGAHSVNVAGRLKVVGIAQRVVRGAALTSAVVVAGGGPAIRAAVRAVYTALGGAVDAATAGSLDEVVPGVTAAQLAADIVAAYGRRAVLRPRPVDGTLRAAADRRAPRHRVA